MQIIKGEVCNLYSCNFKERNLKIIFHFRRVLIKCFLMLCVVLICIYFCLVLVVLVHAVKLNSFKRLFFFKVCFKLFQVIF